MAGAGLLEIKRRIRSIRNTQKITRAMGLVARVKFKKLKERADEATLYFKEFDKSMKLVLSDDDIENSIYFKENKADVDIYIVITSDSGLCGSYNSNVINETLEHMYGKKVLVTAVGERGRSFFLRNNYETLGEFVDLGDMPSYRDAMEILGSSIEAFKEGKARNVYLVYTKFYSAVKQTVEIKKILPIEKPEEKMTRLIDYEPSPLGMFEYVVSKYLSATTFYSLLNSIASEYSIRMSAMDSATKNASDILDKLQLKYNRARQSSITQEITEIVSGAEALKD